MPTLQSSCANILLQSCSEQDFAALRPHLERVNVARGEVVAEAGEFPEFIHFPEGGVFSILSGLDEPTPTEIGLFGFEGMSNLNVVMGAERASFRTMVQINGHTTLRAATVPVLALLEESATLRATIMKFGHTLLVQISQSLVSMANHHVEARLARWLLMCSDRMGENNMALTHEFMATMLGVQRSTVTVTLHVLEGIGAIRSTRGQVTLRDREKLEDLAGTTYGFAEAEYRRLIAPFGTAPAQPS